MPDDEEVDAMMIRQRSEGDSLAGECAGRADVVVVDQCQLDAVDRDELRAASKRAIGDQLVSLCLSSTAVSYLSRQNSCRSTKE